MSPPKHGLTRFDLLVRECLHEADAPLPLPQTFGRLGPHNPVTGLAPDGDPFDDQDLVDTMRAAVDGMRAEGEKDGPAAAGMTFLGQFIDHDITLDATSAIGERIDPAAIRNVRTPALDLDCVYGDGPEASPHLYHPDREGFLLFGRHDNPLDLARTDHGVALIGDPRNDENQIVGQVQGAFITAHNIALTCVMDQHALFAEAFEGVSSQMVEEAVAPQARPFEAARRLLRLHYHWIVLNDFLPSFVDAGVLAHVRHKIEHGHLPDPFRADSPVMPVEFSGAAYRFGHATVRNSYTINATSGPVATFDRRLLGFGRREKANNAELRGLFDYPGNHAFEKARPISRALPSSIFDLPFVHDEIRFGSVTVPVADARKLPFRNLLRDRVTFELASGQQMAELVGADPIAAPSELRDQGITKTPLWYYCLHEAESHGGKLGPVGGTIVAGTIMRLMMLDGESLLRSGRGFQPLQAFGATAAGRYSMGHLLKWVEENRGLIANPEELYNG